MDFSHIVCPETDVTAREAAVCARVARDDLGGDVTVPLVTTRFGRRRAMAEDVQVLTGLLALELTADADDPDARQRAARRAREVHRATLHSQRFALHAALALVALDHEDQR